MRMNSTMSALLGSADIRARDEDAPEPFRAVVREGWTVDGDAHVLKALRSGYIGVELEDFSDTIHFEVTVNGRTMTDYDLPPSGSERLESLMRRSLGYAYAALRAVPEGQKCPMLGYVTLSEGGLEDGTLSAHVTFCSERPELPRYVDDINSYTQEALLEISQEDAAAAINE